MKHFTLQKQIELEDTLHYHQRKLEELRAEEGTMKLKESKRLIMIDRQENQIAKIKKQLEALR